MDLRWRHRYLPLPRWRERKADILFCNNRQNGDVWHKSNRSKRQKKRDAALELSAPARGASQFEEKEGGARQGGEKIGCGRCLARARGPEWVWCRVVRRGRVGRSEQHAATSDGGGALDTQLGVSVVRVTCRGRLNKVRMGKSGEVGGGRKTHLERKCCT